MKYPEVVLRNAEVDYSEIGSDPTKLPGIMTVDGRLYPALHDTVYKFSLQSRGQTQGMGPALTGEFSMANLQVTAQLSNLQFGHDVQAMLPRQVLEFWLAHQFDGALDIPEFDYSFATPDRRAKFKLRTHLKDMRMVVRSDEFTQQPIASIGPSPELTNLPHLARVDQTARRMVAWLHPLPARPPIPVNNVTGDFVFDENGIAFDNLTASIAGNSLVANGKIAGYSPDAPVSVTLESLPGQTISIPENADFLPSMPQQVHQAFSMLQPHGTGTVKIRFDGVQPNGVPRVNGELNIIDGCFDCIFFPYPIHGATGTVLFHPDPNKRFIMVEMQDIHGHGPVGGPNEKASFCINGWAGGDNPDVGCRVFTNASGFQSEPALFSAFPPPVRHALSIFKGLDDGPSPRFAGDFDCQIYIPPGRQMRPRVNANLHFTDGAGKLVAFAYPLENMHGDVAIHDGFLITKDLHFSHENATANVNGRVDWIPDLPPEVEAQPKPDLNLVIRNLPLDTQLLKVLPPQARGWLHTVGATGMLDVNGHVIPNPRPTPTEAVGYDLDVRLRDGTAHPVATSFTVADVSGKLMIHADRMEVLALQGKRGDATLTGNGTVDWTAAQPLVKLNVAAEKLALDAPLSQILPAQAHDAWKALDPHGTVNAGFFYSGAWPAPPSEAIASLDIPSDSIIVAPTAQADDFRLTLEPTDVTVTPKVLPYQLDHCTGRIVVTPKDVTIEKIEGWHNHAQIDVTGKCVTANPSDWDLSLRAKDLPADHDLHSALPLPLQQLLDNVKYKGDLSVDLKSVRYRGDKSDADVDLSGTISSHNGSVDVSVPVDGIDGDMAFDAAVRAGKLAAFRGTAQVNQMSLVNRPVKNLSATLEMPSGSDVLTIGSIRGELAGGELAGQMDLTMPDTEPSSYKLDFQVKNADLREMAKQVAPKGQQVRGLVSASLALQGDWSDIATRRGRGDVLVAGKEMYQIPLLLGLLEVTNLSLPTSSPFNEGSARYLVEGNRVTFEQVQMRNNTMLMSGNGWLDFGSKQVRMNFTTENPNLPSLPIVHDLWEGAKQELLQIQVRGTVQSPKVSAASLKTFTTTVDQVFSGNGKEK